MRGWHARLDGERPDTPAVAVILKKDFPEPELVREVLQAAPEGTVFVVRDRDEACKTILKGLALPYVSAPLNPLWKGGKGESAFDRRSAARAEEILNTCHRVIVFTTQTSASEDEYVKGPIVRENLRIVERGKAPAKRHKKGRKSE